MYWKAIIRSPRSLHFYRLNNLNSLIPSSQKMYSTPLSSEFGPVHLTELSLKQRNSSISSGYQKVYFPLHSKALGLWTDREHLQAGPHWNTLINFYQIRTEMKSKTGQEKGTDILLSGHRVSSLLYALASDDQPLQGKKVFIKKKSSVKGSEVCSLLSPTCSHAVWYNIHWCYSSQFPYYNYFALTGPGTAIIFLSWLDSSPSFQDKKLN